LSEKGSNEPSVEAPPADAGNTAPPKEGEKKDPLLPYKPNTDKWRAAKALLSGETDRRKIVREQNVSISTVYNVTGEFAEAGIHLPIHDVKRDPHKQTN